VPLEAGDENEPVAAFYNYALKLANVTRIFTTSLPNPTTLVPGGFVDPTVLVRPTIFAQAALYTFLSEADRYADLVVRHYEAKNSFTVTIPAQRALLLLVERKTGQVISSSLPIQR
jgi:hypothetical protein